MENAYPYQITIKPSNSRFTQWLEEELNNAIRAFARDNTNIDSSYIQPQYIEMEDISGRRERLRYDLPGSNRIYVQFRFEFATQQRGGLHLGRGILVRPTAKMGVFTGADTKIFQ